MSHPFGAPAATSKWLTWHASLALIQMKRHEIVVEWILSFLFSLSLFSFSLHLNMNDLRYFIRSHWHDDSIWTNISSSQKNWRVIISFCFYSISRRWLSMLWACHFFHKRGNIDRYRKYDTAFSLSYSFFLWSCVILNWINI
jgi:hypothetical protein